MCDFEASNKEIRDVAGDKLELYDRPLIELRGMNGTTVILILRACVRACRCTITYPQYALSGHLFYFEIKVTAFTVKIHILLIDFYVNLLIRLYTLISYD